MLRPSSVSLHAINSSSGSTAKAVWLAKIEMVLLRHIALGLFASDVIEESDGVPFARIKEEMQEIVVTEGAPTALADRMHQRNRKSVTIILHRLDQLPGWPRRVIAPTKHDFHGIFGCMARSGQIARAHAHGVVEALGLGGVVALAK